MYNYKKIVFVAMGTALLVVAFFTGQYYSKLSDSLAPENGTEKISSPISISDQVIAPDQNWKTYTDSARGFSFKVPPTFSVTKDNKGAIVAEGALDAANSTTTITFVYSRGSINKMIEGLWAYNVVAIENNPNGGNTGKPQYVRVQYQTGDPTIYDTFILPKDYPNSPGDDGSNVTMVRADVIADSLKAAVYQAIIDSFSFSQ